MVAEPDDDNESKFGPNSISNRMTAWRFPVSRRCFKHGRCMSAVDNFRILARVNRRPPRLNF